MNGAPKLTGLRYGNAAFERLSLRDAYWREALTELRTMRRRAYAHGARIARALRDSLTFHGAEAAVWASNSALSVSALGVSVCKSEDSSVLRKPI